MSLLENRCRGGWTGDSIIADWHDIGNNVASEVHAKSLKFKEEGMKNLQDAFIFLCADGSLRQEGHLQRQTSRHQRVGSLNAGGVPSTLGEAGSDSLQREGGVADVFEADRDGIEGRFLIYAW